MAALRKIPLFFLLALAIACCEKTYRYDYEWSEEARGWLKYQVVPATWNQARKICHAEGAVLASPLTYQLRAAVVSLVQRKSNSDSQQGSIIFSGVHSIFSEGVYTSVEGVPLRQLAINWEAGEPDNFENQERCLAMMVGANSNGSMADTRCDRPLPYVCYKKYAQLTMTGCGTTDPGYALDKRTGSCYKLHETGQTWSNAFMTCQAEGGHLVIINSELEARVVREIIAKHPARYFTQRHGTWMAGFHDWGSDAKHFMTIHGESLEYNYNVWGPGEPNNLTYPPTGDFKQSCGAVFKDARLDDNHCNVPYEFICEKLPKSLLHNYY